MRAITISTSTRSLGIPSAGLGIICIVLEAVNLRGPEVAAIIARSEGDTEVGR